jgi:hypothetical protein
MAIHHAVVRNRLIFGQNYFYRVVLDCREFEPLIETVRDRYRLPVDDDGEDRPIHH